ncbi:ABC transporter ATP-binding protein [Terrarubrum flagellatum]|uniref:ABC transporter ATP-binding protein n=1 Tax=Terrirubrum flagellatum TaxID=2895980 RepID=UPI0031450FF6
MSEPFLSLEKLTLAYSGSVAVDSLDLAMRDGELIALLGPSGCGKTTTMRAIAGLLTPQSGCVRLAGRDITKTPPNKREVGLMFQSYALFPHLSVFENVAFGLRLKKAPAADIQRRVADALESVGLSGLADRLPKALSGGQQQRVALARSIVVRPRLLLLDEPLSNLDARLRLEMRSELSRLQRELAMPMIYVTHDQTEALALAHRIIVMRGGRIEQDGAPDDIYARPKSAFVARFMGFENIFTVSDGKLNGAAGAVAWPVATTAAALAWRPRHVTVGAGPLQGRVLGASYLGEAVEYLIDSAIGSIKAEAPADAPRCAPGETIAFDLPAAKAASLPAA